MYSYEERIRAVKLYINLAIHSSMAKRKEGESAVSSARRSLTCAIACPMFTRFSGAPASNDSSYDNADFCNATFFAPLPRVARDRFYPGWEGTRSVSCNASGRSVALVETSIPPIHPTHAFFKNRQKTMSNTFRGFSEKSYAESLQGQNIRLPSNSTLGKFIDSLRLSPSLVG